MSENVIVENLSSINFDIENAKNSIKIIENLSIGAKDYFDYSQKFTATIYREDSEAYNCMMLFFKILKDYGVKLCVQKHPLDFSLVGGGNLHDYVPQLKGNEDQFLKEKFYACYFPDCNTIFFKFVSDPEKDIIGLNWAYGIDLLSIREDFLKALYSVYFHESLHAFFKNTINFNINLEEIPDIKHFKNSLSRACQMNKLIYLEPIVNSTWEEMITHLVSNKKYVNFINYTNSKYYVSAVVSSVIKGVQNEEKLKYTIDAINFFIGDFLGIKDKILLHLTDYTSQNLFLSNEYFKQYPSKVLGIETIKKNNFGEEVIIVEKSNSKDNIEDILSFIINESFIDFSEFDNLFKIEVSLPYDEIKNKINKSIEAKSHEGKKALTDEVITFAESVKKYSLKEGYLTQLEIEAYLYCYPEERKELWLNELKYSEKEILESKTTLTLNKGFSNECTITVPTVIFNGYSNEFCAFFCHGNLSNKIEELKSNEKEIVNKRGREYFDDLIKSLESASKVNLSFDNENYEDRPFLNPLSYFAKNIIIGDYLTNRDKENNKNMLLDAYISTLVSGDWYKRSRYDGVTSNSIIDFIKGRDSRSNKFDLNDEKDSILKLLEEEEIKNALMKSFSDFIKECLFEEDKKKIINIIMKFYNQFTFTDLNKIPVGFEHSACFKTKCNFELTELQRNAVAFLNVIGSGTLAYDVGCGKTAAALMHISNRLATGKAHRALIIVPNQVYIKWKNEIKDNDVEINKDGKTIIKHNKGLLNHIELIELGNLNDDIIKSLREYTHEEEKKIEKAKKQKTYFNKKIEEIIREHVPQKVKTKTSKTETDEVYDSDEDSDFEKAKVKFKLNDKTNVLAITKELNQLFKEIDIEAFSIFGITNEENKNLSSIINAINSSHNQNSLAPEIIDLFEEFGIKIGRIINIASNVNTYIIISVIINILYDAVNNLDSFYINTLGRVRDLPEKAIFIATHSSIKGGKWGFKEETIKQFFEIANEVIKGGSTNDDLEKIKNKIKRIFANSVLNAKVYFEDFDFDYLCIDESHILKNFITKTTTTPEEEKNASQAEKRYIIKGAGQPSTTSFVGFMMSWFINKKTNGKNVTLLTATPFTNSPLEIYSMMAMTNYRYLPENGFPSVKSFSDMFIDFKLDLQVDVSNNIIVKLEPIRFNNTGLMQRIIFNIIDYKTGAEAFIKRPCKVVLPLKENTVICENQGDEYSFISEKSISSITIPIDTQQFIFDALQQYLASQIDVTGTVNEVFKRKIMEMGEDFYQKIFYPTKTNEEYSEYLNNVSELAEIIKRNFNYDRRENKVVDKVHPSVAILKTLMAFRLVSISPFMFKPYVQDYLKINCDDEKNIRTDDIIISSSKLMYVLGCIRKANEYFDKNNIKRKCFVIYSNLGVRAGKNSPISLLERIKEYLLDPKNGFGYKEKSVKVEEDGKRYTFSEVETILGSNMPLDKRAALIDKFNKGEVKVILTTIKEGVDLQGNTIGLFNISVDWNPTDAKQVEGRSWRQGNRNAYCIINYPMVANSSDMVLYQKLQDKTNRLKQVWDRKNVKSQFDLGEFDPQKLKIEMISSVDKLAPFLYMSENEVKRRKVGMLKAKFEDEQTVITTYLYEFNRFNKQTRFSLHFFTRLPIILRMYLDVLEYRKTIEENEAVINALKNEIENAKSSNKYALNIKEVNDKIENIQKEIKELKIKMAEYFSEEKMAEANKVKQDIKGLEDKIEKLETEKKDIEKKIDEDLKDEIKEKEKEIKKREKEIVELNEKIEKILSSPELPAYGEDIKIEGLNLKENIDLKSFKESNFFSKTEDNDEDLIFFNPQKQRLENINWAKATLLDIAEGLRRVVRAYEEGQSYYNIIKRFIYNSPIGNTSTGTSVEFKEIDKVLNGLALKVLEYDKIGVDIDTVSNEEDKEKIMFYNTISKIISIGQYKDEYFFHAHYVLEMFKESRESLIYKAKIENRFYCPNVAYSEWRIIKRSVNEFKGIVGDRNPEEYLKELKSQIEELNKEVGGQNINAMPIEVVQKYVTKASEIVNERMQNYGNYAKLIDDFISLSHIMNKEIKIDAQQEDEKFIEEIQNIGEKQKEKTKEVKVKETKEIKTVVESLEAGINEDVQRDINIYENIAKGVYVMFSLIDDEEKVKEYEKKYNEIKLIIDNLKEKLKIMIEVKKFIVGEDVFYAKPDINKNGKLFIVVKQRGDHFFIDRKFKNYEEGERRAYELAERAAKK